MREHPEETGFEFDNWEYVSYDLWGNPEDGYEVNDKFATGQIYEIEDWETDYGVIRFLQLAGFVGTDTDEMDIDVDGDENTIYVDFRGSPVCEFIRTDSPATQGSVQ